MENVGMLVAEGNIKYIGLNVKFLTEFELF